MKIEIIAPIIAIIVPVIVFSIFTVVVIYGIRYQIKQNKSIIKRAKMIDPSVETLSEAQFVLEKEIAKNYASKAIDKINKE